MISRTTFSAPESRMHFAILPCAILMFSVIPFSRSVTFAQTTGNRGVGVNPASVVKTLPDKAKRYALVIGVDDYEDTQITTLGGAANDARALADALGRYAGFPSDQVILMASDQPVERRPTRGNILRRLSNLRGVMPKDGLLLVAFAGHGIERGGQAFLLPSDAQVSGDVRLLEDTAINVTRMKEGIKETGVRQVVFILDACRNDPTGRANADNPLTQAYARSFNFDVRNREVEAFVTLYATAVGARAYEYKEKRQGYFTWALVEALKGRAANEKGEVTLSGLVKHLQEEVPKLVRLDLGKDQRPFANFEGYKADELVIAARGQGQYAINSPFSTSDKAKSERGKADEVIWDAIKNSPKPQDFKDYIKEFPEGRYVEKARQRLKDLAAQGISNPAISGAGPPSTTPANTGVTITLANCSISPDENIIPSHLMIQGQGWDGGSKVKVIANGQDISARIESQNQYLIQLKGRAKDLSLLNGKNEIVVVVNGVTSNTYVFSQAMPGVKITAGSCYLSQNEKRIPSFIALSLQGWDGVSAIKAVVNGQEIGAKIESQNQYLIQLQGSAKELNLISGRNEVVVVVDGVASNTYIISAR